MITLFFVLVQQVLGTTEGLYRNYINLNKRIALWMAQDFTCTTHDSWVKDHLVKPREDHLGKGSFMDDPKGKAFVLWLRRKTLRSFVETMRNF